MSRAAFPFLKSGLPLREANHNNDSALERETPMSVTKSLKSRPFRVFALSCLTLALVGCGAIQPKPFTEAEIKERVANDRIQMYADQEPIAAPIDFYEASARALKYNLDYKLKLME